MDVDREAIIRELLARYPQLDRYICDLIVPLEKKIFSVE